jgi:cardiolipin synthase
VSNERLVLPEAVGSSGDAVCRVVTDGPDEDLDKLLLIIVGAVSAATRRVIIMTPYFIPPLELVAALQAAALRGIEVSILLPARSNLRYVDWATQRWLPPLLERGVRVFLQPPPFAHTKLLIVDGEYVQIGSANIDPRSLRLNFEIAMEVFDAGIGAQLTAFAERALAKSSPFTLQDAARRRLPARIRDSLFWLLSPYL